MPASRGKSHVLLSNCPLPGAWPALDPRFPLGSWPDVFSSPLHPHQQRLRLRLPGLCGLGSVLGAFAVLSLDPPLRAGGPRAWFSWGGDQDRKTGAQGPAAAGGHQGGAAAESRSIHIQRACLLACLRRELLGGETPGGERWACCRREEGVVLFAFPALPWVGKHLVTVFSDVPVFKVIFFLKCNFPTLFPLGDFPKGGGSLLGGRPWEARQAWWSWREVASRQVVTRPCCFCA